MPRVMREERARGQDQEETAMRNFSRRILMVGWTFLIACGGESPVVTSPPTPTHEPTPGPVPTPTPAPTPTPEPVNHPPTVTLSGGGSCHPKRSFAGTVQPCAIAFAAAADDPDGDHLSYSWSGCASGTGKTATCLIDAIRTFTATVTVKDGRGGKAKASATAAGVNHPPLVRIGGPKPPNPAPANTFYSLVAYQPEDEDVDSNELCGHVTVRASGPCRAGVGLCGGVSDGFDVDLGTLDGPGRCTVEARVSDPWGAVATDQLAFDVLPPQ